MENEAFAQATAQPNFSPYSLQNRAGAFLATNFDRASVVLASLFKISGYGTHSFVLAGKAQFFQRKTNRQSGASKKKKRSLTCFFTRYLSGWGIALCLMTEPKTLPLALHQKR